MKTLVLIFLALLYTLSPVDILPEMLVGPLGWLEDLILWGVLIRYIFLQQGKRHMYEQTGQYQYEKENQHNSDNGRKYDNAGSSDEFRNPYTVLGLNEKASPLEIKQAYRELASKYHPDKVNHLGEEFRELAEKRFKEINQAYQQLTDYRLSGK